MVKDKCHGVGGMMGWLRGIGVPRGQVGHLNREDRVAIIGKVILE